MLRFAGDLTGLSVNDISSGREIASVTDVVINPHNLSIAAFRCYMRSLADERFLLVDDIHEHKLGVLTVQNAEALADATDVVRLQELLEINYEVLGKSVKTESKKRVGVVNDYVVDDKSMLINKLYVRPPITKVIQSSDRIIGRNQVVEVSDKVITVKDSTIKVPRTVRAGADA